MKHHYSSIKLEFSINSYFKYFSLLLLFLVASLGYGQTVTIGSGTNIGSKLPVVPWYAYSFSEQIIPQTEINTAGSISKIRFYSTGTGLTNGNNWTIYLGHTSKATFTSTTDWILSSAMTPVFSGTIPVSPAAGWMEITLTTPFIYNNTNNLVIAVDENAIGSTGGSGDNYFRIFTLNF